MVDVQLKIKYAGGYHIRIGEDGYLLHIDEVTGNKERGDRVSF